MTYESVAARTYDHMLSSTQVCELTGATYRQLDYWARSNLIPGQEHRPGSGFRRRWGPAQVERVQELLLMQRLRNLPYREMMRMLEQLRTPGISAAAEHPALD